MERKSFADMDCSVAQCLEVVGEWWSMLIVRDVFLGVSRFDDFQRRLGISRNILQQRLARLVDAGVLARVPYSEHPPRYDYRLTDKGRDLWPVLTAMRQWGDRYARPVGPAPGGLAQGVRRPWPMRSWCAAPVASRSARETSKPSRAAVTGTWVSRPTSSPPAGLTTSRRGRGPHDSAGRVCVKPSEHGGGSR